MQYTEFPSHFRLRKKKAVDNFEDRKDDSYRAFAREKRYELNDQIKQMEKYRPKEKTVGYYVWRIIIIAVIIILILAIWENDLGEVIAGHLALFFFIDLLSFATIPLWRKLNRRVIAKWEAGVDDVKKKAEEEIARYKQAIDKEIQEYSEKCDREIKEYKEGFEKTAQENAKKYDDSKFLNKITNEITQKCWRYITSADRSTNVENINRRYSIEVYDISVMTCPDGYYAPYRSEEFEYFCNFDKMRIANLDNAIAQGAVAHALAEQIKKNIIEQYPKDITGTNYRINIEYDYGEESAICILTYTAENGNYKPIQNW